MLIANRHTNMCTGGQTDYDSTLPHFVSFNNFANTEAWYCNVKELEKMLVFLC